MAHQSGAARQKIILERTFDAPLEAAWNLWTTAKGIESWWGPEGFEVKVRRLNVSPGGELVYVMTATHSDQIDFLTKAGMPLVIEHRVTFTEVSPMRRLAFTDLADFIPGVEPYEVATVVDFEFGPKGWRMVLTFDAMHDEQWTRLAVMGREMELDKLVSLLQA